MQENWPKYMVKHPIHYETQEGLDYMLSSFMKLEFYTHLEKTGFFSIYSFFKGLLSTGLIQVT